MKEPSNPRFYNQLGLAHYYKEDLTEAIRNYETAIQLDPTYYLAYNNLGYASEKGGKLREAVEAFKYYMQYVRGTPAARETLEHIRELEKQIGPESTPETAPETASVAAPESTPEATVEAASAEETPAPTAAAAPEEAVPLSEQTLLPIQNDNTPPISDEASTAAPMDESASTTEPSTEATVPPKEAVAEVDKADKPEAVS